MNIEGAKKVKQGLINNGLKDDMLNWALAQAAIESAGFTSGLFLDDNNASGIVYAPNKYEGATPSTKHHIPSKEVGKGTPYCHWDNIDLYAKAFIGRLQSNRGGTGTPITATTLEDYVSRLSANHYFVAEPPMSQDTAKENYLKGISSWIKRVETV